MSFLLDTNIVSEWMKARPEPAVVAWLATAAENDIFLSVVTFAEIRAGIDKLPNGARKQKLSLWLANDLPQRFEDKIIVVDTVIADAWGAITAQRRRIGRPIGAMDALIAATARVHDLEIVTRNTADFEGLGIELINPWLG